MWYPDSGECMRNLLKELKKVNQLYNLKTFLHFFVEELPLRRLFPSPALLVKLAAAFVARCFQKPEEPRFPKHEASPCRSSTSSHNSRWVLCARLVYLPFTYMFFMELSVRDWTPV